MFFLLYKNRIRWNFEILYQQTYIIFKNYMILVKFPDRSELLQLSNESCSMVLVSIKKTFL
jgi:hypothetical protein